MADGKIPEGNPSIIDRWFRTPISRRELGREVAKGTVIAGAAAAGGFGIGREAEFRFENPSDVTDEPWEIQIRKLELRGGKDALKDENLRNLYTWLTVMWYGAGHSFGVFDDPNDEYASATAMYKAIAFIDNETDPELEGHENFAGWTYPREAIVLNLISPDLKELNTTGGVITPLMSMRDTLVHELTHFITEDRSEGQSIDIFRKIHPEVANIKDVKISGFRMIFDPDPNDPNAKTIDYLIDFDEASTELIANYYQKIAGLAVGLPSYPEENQTDSNQSKIEKTLGALEATLTLAGISMDQFAQLHSTSNLDGLAKAFSDAATRTFSDDVQKVEYGLTIIDSFRTLDRKVIGQYIQEIKP